MSQDHALCRNINLNECTFILCLNLDRDSVFAVLKVPGKEYVQQVFRFAPNFTFCRKTTSTSTILTLITLNLGDGCGLLALLAVHKPHGRKKNETTLMLLNYS